MSARTELADLDARIEQGEAVDPVSYVELRTRAEVEARIAQARERREVEETRVAQQDAEQAAKDRVVAELPAIVERVRADTRELAETRRALGYQDNLRYAVELASLADDVGTCAGHLLAAITDGPRQGQRPGADLRAAVEWLRNDHLHLWPEVAYLDAELVQIIELVTPVVPLVDR